MNDQLDALLDEGANETTLQELAALASILQTKIGDVDRLNDQLKAAKAEVAKIQEQVLPEAMKAANVPEFMHGDTKIKLFEKMYCSVPAKRKGEIIAALREDGHGEMISNVLTVKIDKGKDNMAASLAETAAELGFEPVREESVNTGSLKALLTRRIKDGDDVDLSFYGAHARTVAEVK